MCIFLYEVNVTIFYEKTKEWFWTLEVLDVKFSYDFSSFWHPEGPGSHCLHPDQSADQLGTACCLCALLQDHLRRDRCAHFVPFHPDGIRVWVVTWKLGSGYGIRCKQVHLEDSFFFFFLPPNTWQLWTMDCQMKFRSGLYPTARSGKYSWGKKVYVFTNIVIGKSYIFFSGLKIYQIFC